MTHDKNSDPLHALTNAGVSIWLDELSRDILENGEFEHLVRSRSVVGVTTNPTIFANAITRSSRYAAQLEQLAGNGIDVAESVRALTISDVQHAAEVLRPIWEKTDGVDGRVSLEVSPELAGDTGATIAEAIQLWELVDRPNLMVKIPATPAGVKAVTGALAAGVNVNVTLVFSAQRCAEVGEAYVEGLEQARENGHDLASLHSVSSLFVSRVDTEVDMRLDAMGVPELRGQAALANARLAHEALSAVWESSRWQSLAAEGARPQRLLWASTGVKDPSFPDTKYVTGLITPGTVSTMPPATLSAFADHGEVPGDQVVGRGKEAAADIAAVAAAGVDLDDVYNTLLSQGVAKFSASWRALHASVGALLG
ncbi:transaldolase [Amycolatopsis sp. FDAARGOS 1241]|uniref:transaldolase n=1 Tax=Amycolatopsis sp. FDAARGOS 1241 TaxID=2778070 RepID=UPI0019502187|nr:transaldolase [Amycolatopsis sp. FDAARGOS 1241]QRP48606.1 transaldolase [Amycolatopsis sp. FDAARGOS 1241]